jgi:hypothetical protein
LDNVEQGAIEGLGPVKGLIQEAVGHFAIVLSNLINADRESSQPSIEHKEDFGLVAARSLILFILLERCVCMVERVLTRI